LAAAWAWAWGRGRWPELKKVWHQRQQWQLQPCRQCLAILHGWCRHPKNMSFAPAMNRLPDSSLVPPGLMGLVPQGGEGSKGAGPAGPAGPAAFGPGSCGGKGWLPPGMQAPQLRLRLPPQGPQSRPQVPQVPPRIIPARTDVPSRAQQFDGKGAMPSGGGHAPPAAFSAGVASMAIQNLSAVSTTSASSSLKRPAPGTVPTATAETIPSVEEAAPVEERHWFYKDAAGNEQGPYPSSVMSGWSRSGFFPPETMVRSEDEAEFSELGNGMRLTLASMK